MLKRLRETLALVLIIALPFHAFVVTVGTYVLFGADHAPSGLLALWKEALLALILFLTLLEMLVDIRRVNRSLDSIDGCILALLVLAGALQYWHPVPLKAFLYGIKYDFVALIAFFILRRIDWSEWFKAWAMRGLLIVAAIVVLYGLISLLLPESLFRKVLGYSDFHSLYKPGSPLAPFQNIQNTSIRRMQSVMSGPNQLGLWLLLPWSIALTAFSWKGKTSLLFSSRRTVSIVSFAVALLIFPALFFTYSRTAWIAAAIIAFLLLLPSLVRVLQGIASIIIAILLIPVVLFFFYTLTDVPVRFEQLPVVSQLSPYIRLGSSRGHLELPLDAMLTMKDHPLGIGLGTAGPASNAISEACVMLLSTDDPSWAKNQPDLCVFTGTKQVQPKDRSCHCPRLTENWYLQIGVELGIAGFALFVILIIQMLRTFADTAHGRRTVLTEEAMEGTEGRRSELGTAMLFTFLGLSLAAFLLHAWEDAAVAYTVWLLCAASIASPVVQEE